MTCHREVNFHSKPVSKYSLWPKAELLDVRGLEDNADLQEQHADHKDDESLIGTMLSD
jgi:hypothetical protein